ncbi:ThiF family adenylyltransferase [Thiopseudomonas alkaliphila]|uniref:ThiF family adenylyltransferase n=1 Tax=Thiopseudomonas alkaliphila TaxID=1697053 RepID=UPI00069FE960|nr:ThiF family adenylyltransferase [Thiopseudomonas alkaliphila]
MINYDDIVRDLEDRGYRIEESIFLDQSCLTVTLNIDNNKIELIHFKLNQLTEMPSFFVKNPLALGRLAHISLYEIQGEELGGFCVNTPDSLSINFDRPALVFEETLERYEKLLTEVITDEVFNKSEQLREFQAHWLNIYTDSNKKIICTSESGDFEVLDIYAPSFEYGLGSYYIADSKESELTVFFETVLKNNSKKTERKRGYVLPLQSLSPAPWCKEELSDYYRNCLSQLSEKDYTLFRNQSGYRSDEFWLMFNAPTPSGKTWFCIYLKLKDRKSKKSLPINREALDKWDISAIEIISFNRELMMPRSGAEVALSDKKVLLVGGGSVGGEIAEKLASSGLGFLDMIDPDCFSLDNLFRHTLDLNSLNRPKTSALQIKLLGKNPWLNTRAFYDKLLILTRNELIKRLESYDLIIIAIGNPTHERLFSRKLKESNINVPVINTWVEGYGVGGHAILDVSTSKGCLYCAYTDSLGINGLNSNLNFLKADQNLTKNHGGCGSAFLPYSGLSASQTALIATDLALKYLLEEITESSKISWKGSEVKAKEEGFELTDRYYLFQESLMPLSLHNPLCDFCNVN